MYSNEILLSAKFDKSLPEGRRIYTLQKLKYFFIVYAESPNKKIHTGARPMEIRGIPGVYKLRTSRGERVLYEVSGDNRIILREFSSHDNQITRAKNMEKNKSGHSSFTSLFDALEEEHEFEQYEIEQADDSPLNMEQTEIIIATDEWLAGCEDTEDYIWLASAEQEKIISSNQYPQFISGSAGTGKSTVLFQKLCGLTGNQGEFLYITISSALKDDFQRVYEKFKPKQETARISFLTLNGLFESLLSEHKRIATQELFLSEFSRECQTLKINPYDVWCEVEGIIKSHLGITEQATISFLDQLLSSVSTTLSRENYGNVSDKYSYFSKDDRDKIHGLAERYDRWLAGQNLTDANQLAAEIIKSGVKRKYDLILIDEVQDFTELQLFMLMGLAKSETRIIFCGDINQNVRPTFFMFERLYNMYYALGCKDAKENMYTLTKNYRSCKEIVCLLNKILDEQRLRIGFQRAKEDEGIHETGFREGCSPLYLESTEENLIKMLNTIYDKHYAIVVVPDEQSRKELVGFFPEAKGRVFTVQEAKGLEYDVVFTINVTSAYENEWRKILDGDGVKRNRKFRQFFGYIYVAASRARNHLVITEQADCSFLELVGGTYEALDEWDLAKVGLVRQSSAADFDKDASKLEKAGLTDKADEARAMAKKMREKTELKTPVSPIIEEAPDLTGQSPMRLTKKLFLIEQDNKQGILNDKGDVLVECKYDSISYSPYKDENGKTIFECHLNNKITYYDQNGVAFEPEVSEPHNQIKKRKKLIAVLVAAFLLSSTFLAILLIINPFQTKSPAKIEMPEPISSFIEGKIISVSAGDNHSAALTEDGTVWTWGNNLLDGDIASYKEVEGKWSISIDYGSEDNKPTNKKAAIDDVAYVTTGRYVTAAIKNDGSLWTWGYNNYGALGNGIDYATPGTAFKIDSLPYKIMENVVSVSLGDFWGMAVQADGTLWTWGMNHYGTLGNGTTEDSCKPVKVMDGVAMAKAGLHHALALKKDGTVWVWGSNQNGQLRDADHTANIATRPQKIMKNASQIFAGYYQSWVIKKDGTSWAWGPAKDGGTTKPAEVDTGNLEEVVQVVNGRSMILLLSNNGKLYTWTTNSDDLVELMDSVVQVSMFGDHFLVIKEDGSIWAWGENEDGQLGDGTTKPQKEPVLIYRNSQKNS